MNLNNMWMTIEGTAVEGCGGGLRGLVEEQIGIDLLDEETEGMKHRQTAKVLVAVMVQAAIDRDYAYFGEDFEIHCKLLRLNPVVVKKMFKVAWGCEDDGIWNKPDSEDYL